MSHADSITEAPPGFTALATTPEAPVAALADVERQIYGVQFHPEVIHTERGQQVLERFLFDVCGARPTWTHTNIIESSLEAVRAQVGDAARAVRAVGRGRLGRGRRSRAPCHRRPAHLCVRRHRPHAHGRGRPGRGDVPSPVPDGPRPRQSRRPVLLGPRRDDRPRGQAQGHRRDLHPRVRGGGHRRRRRPLPRAGDAVPRHHRVRHLGRGHHQVAPQRGRPARGHGVRT